MFDKAGEFYEKLTMQKKAMEFYIKGNAYKKAINLAKKAFPGEITKLEEKWGDYLMSLKQIEESVNHYIDAGAVHKAIEASIGSRQWKVALELLTNLPSDVSRP